MDKPVVEWKNVIFFAGAFSAFLIGSGFVTGQEVLQYFAAYGYRGIAGAATTCVLFVYAGVAFISAGHREHFKRGSDIYRYYGGEVIGTFYVYFSLVFLYLSFFVMIAGAGETFRQHYGMPVAVGGILMGTAAGATVISGLRNVVLVIGKVGPVIVVLSIFMGLNAIIRSPSGIAEAEALIPSLHLMKASGNWLFAALSYVGFCILWLAAFMTALGKAANSRKEATLGGILGATGFSLAVLMMALGLMSNIRQTAGAMIPVLLLAENIHPGLAIIFSGLIPLGIYTTAVPLLWAVSSRLAPDGSPRFKCLTLALTAAGIFVGLNIPFDRLVNSIYVINGYVGMFLLLLMLRKDFFPGFRLPKA